MGNVSNLRPFNTMTTEEHRALSRRGGMASGAARRAKRSRIEQEKLRDKANLELIREMSRMLYIAAGSPRRQRTKHKYIYKL